MALFIYVMVISILNQIWKMWNCYDDEINGWKYLSGTDLFRFFSVLGTRAHTAMPKK